jgi:hypothetical protein
MVLLVFGCEVDRRSTVFRSDDTGFAVPYSDVTYIQLAAGTWGGPRVVCVQ